MYRASGPMRLPRADWRGSQLFVCISRVGFSTNLGIASWRPGAADRPEPVSKVVITHHGRS